MAPNYDYDAGGRLIEARYPNGIDQTLVWNADDSLNKIAHKKGGTVTRPSGQSCTGSNQSQYQYDSFQRLNQIQVNGTTTGQYRYDHQGRRIQKTEGATVTNYLYDGPNIYAEYSGTNWYSPSAVYVQAGLDQPLARLTGSVASPLAAALYYHQDGLSSVLAVTDAGRQSPPRNASTPSAPRSAAPIACAHTGLQRTGTGCQRADLLPGPLLRPEPDPLHPKRPARLYRRH